MQKLLHPYLKPVTVICTDGSTYQNMMILGKSNIKLDSDPKSHTLWNVNLRTSTTESKGRIAKFEKRYSSKKLFK